MALTF
jgi:hypothetical protein